MALPVPPLNADGSLRAYTDGEISQMQIQHVGVGDGTHPTVVRRVNESTYTAEYFCAYSALDAFICHQLGAAVKYHDTIAGTDKLSRLVPELYPGKSVFFAAALDEATGHQYTGNQEADGRPIYSKWRCRFVYQHFPFLVASDGESEEHQRFVQELPSTAAPEYITLPGGILKFQKEGGGGASGKEIPYNVGFVNAATQIKKKWIRIPYDGWKAGSTLRSRVFGDIENGVEPWLGTINTQTVFGYAPGQLLFTNVEDELLLDPAIEEQHWNLTYTFLARSVSHNWFKFFDPAGANTGWYFVSNDGNYYDSVSLPDNKSLFNGRDHRGLYAVGNYP